jgi:hypothetical protein
MSPYIAKCLLKGRRGEGILNVSTTSFLTCFHKPSYMRKEGFLRKPELMEIVY